MDRHRIVFRFKGKEYAAIAHLSLQDDGCYIFSFLQDPRLIAIFGADIDIHTDCDHVLPDHVTNEDVFALKVAILEAVKLLPQFQNQRPRKLIIKAKPCNEQVQHGLKK